MLYLDNAATSLKKPFGMYASLFYNTVTNSVNAGHGGHGYSLRGAEKVYDTAELFAEIFNLPSPECVAFTQNATYAINLGIRGIMCEGDHAVTTCMDHNSVLRTLNELGNFTMVGAAANGMVEPRDIEKAIRPETKLIVVSHAANTCGTIQNIREIGKISEKHGIAFMVDAAQSAGSIDIDVSDMGIDLLAVSAHKGLLGPLGLGALYVSPKLKLNPVITGGTGSDSKNINQPRNMPDLFQSGTLNTPSIIAFKRSLLYLKRRGISNIGEEERFLAEKVIEDFSAMPDVTVYGIKKGSMRNGTVLFNIGNYSSTAVAEVLEKKFGIAVRGGLHCAYYAHKALGTDKTGALRASFGAFDGLRAAERLCDAVYDISRHGL